MPARPPAATIRTQLTLPLRFADGYATTARVFSFDGLVDGQEHLAFGLGDWAGVIPSPGWDGAVASGSGPSGSPPIGSAANGSASNGSTLNGSARNGSMPNGSVRDRSTPTGRPPLVRPHSECLTGDVLGSQRCDCGPQLREAGERIAGAGGGPA